MDAESFLRYGKERDMEHPKTIFPYKDLIDSLDQDHRLSHMQWEKLIDVCIHGTDPCKEEVLTYAAQLARQRSKEVFGNKIYLRGLIEISNYCKNNCYYCGIRRDNDKVQRYRLTEEEIVDCARTGYRLGYRTFVLQGGEDGAFTDEVLCRLIATIKNEFSDCAITLSLGEREEKSYRMLYDAGADRYLLRHETANKEHYQSLHPKEMSWENRIHCLKTLKAIGYQTGCGFMVGSPGQTLESLVEDMELIQEFGPAMVGIGPFIPHHQTGFAHEPIGSVELTLYLLSLLRILNPDLLLPATTALGTVDPMGRERGILAGANVLMPNLSPSEVRKQYELYDNKICTGEEAAECRSCLEMRIKKIGYEVVTDRGDSPTYSGKTIN